MPTCSPRSRPAFRALWGPLHGGANQACVEMLEAIRADGGNVAKYVDLAKNKNSGFRLMGFGHRVYKNYDPRATIIKQTCDKLLAKRHINDPIFEIAQKLEEVALQRSVFHRAQAVSERRFLFGRDLSGDGHSGADVHADVRHRPAAGLDRPLDRDGRFADQEDLPAAADLRRPDRAQLRPHGQAQVASAVARATLLASRRLAIAGGFASSQSAASPLTAASASRRC